MPLRSAVPCGLVLLVSQVVVIGRLRAASSIFAPVLFAIALMLLSLAIVAVLGLVILIVYVSLTQLQDNIPGYQEMLLVRLEPLKTALQERAVTAELFAFRIDFALMWGLYVCPSNPPAPAPHPTGPRSSTMPGSIAIVRAISVTCVSGVSMV